MKISERIVAAEADIAEKKDAISALLKSAEADDRDLSDEEQAQVDEHSEVIEEKTKSLSSLKRAEKALATREVSIRDAKETRGTRPASAKKTPPGDLIIKMAAAHALAHQQKMSFQDAVLKMYAADARLEAIVKTQVNPADTTTVGWAAELVDEGIEGFMEELRGESVYAQLANIGVGINFGTNGSVSVPGWGGSGTDLAGSFVAEGAPIPVKRGTMVSQTLNRFKMAVISTFTKELSRSSTPQIEALIRTKILADTAQALDVALLDASAAVAGIRPASILNGAPSQAATGTGTAADVLTDLQFLISTLTANNAGRAPVLIMHPTRELGLMMKTNATGQFVFRSDLNSGTLMGAKVVTSTYVPADTVILLDAADFATAFGSPEFDVSDVATIVEGNDDGVDPQVLPVGEAATAGAPTIRSLFQTWSTGLRMVMPLSWAMMRQNIAYITGAAW